jgi:DNA-binding NarL/FixJ family response regulator
VARAAAVFIRSLCDSSSRLAAPRRVTAAGSASRPATSRQKQVLAASVRCGGQQPAADELGIGLQTVKNTLSALYRKLGVDTATAAVVRLWDDAEFQALIGSPSEWCTPHQRRMPA